MTLTPHSKFFSSFLTKFALVSTVFSYTTAAHAVSLDGFSYTNQNLAGKQIQFESGAVGQTVSNSQNFAGAYGGVRGIQLIASDSGYSSFHVSYHTQTDLPSFFSVNSGYTGAGDLVLSYDGNSTPGVDNYNGLCQGGSCLNLYEGNASGISLGVWYDYGFGHNLPIEFTFYDANDTSGNTYSRGTMVLDRRYIEDSFTDVFLSFSQLNQFGSGGAANLANIGAFSIAVNGSGKLAYDVGFTNFRTNGTSSSAVPEPSTIGLLFAGAVGFARRKSSLNHS